MKKTKKRLDIEAMKAIREIQEESQRNGKNKLTLDEINEEIKRARKERQRRNTK